MESFIEDFYYGNINPQIRCRKPDTETQAELDILEETEKYFSEKLTGKDKEKFLRYTAAWDKVNGEANCDSFVTGFRLGARFALDTFHNDKTQLADLLKEEE